MVQLSIDTIRTLSVDAVQQAKSGHPEYHWVSGVETTTGPLGQGVATSVGMGVAKKWLAHCYPARFGMFNCNVYAVCGDNASSLGKGIRKLKVRVG